MTSVVVQAPTSGWATVAEGEKTARLLRMAPVPLLFKSKAPKCKSHPAFSISPLADHIFSVVVGKTSKYGLGIVGGYGGWFVVDVDVGGDEARALVEKHMGPALATIVGNPKHVGKLLYLGPWTAPDDVLRDLAVNYFTAGRHASLQERRVNDLQRDSAEVSEAQKQRDAANKVHNEAGAAFNDRLLPWLEEHKLITGHRTAARKDAAGNVILRIEIKSFGDIIAMPPSLHPDIEGLRFSWNNGVDPHPVALTHAPRARREQVDALLQEAGGNGSTFYQVKAPKTVPAEIHVGDRDVALASVAGKLRRMGLEPQEMLPALQAVNANRCADPLPEKDVEKIANSIGKKPASELVSADDVAAVEVDRLARLSKLAYERERKEAAKRLGIRERALDAAVAGRRAELEEEAANEPMADIEPWPEPVDGAELIAGMTHAFHRHAVLPEQGGFVGSLWCIHAHAHDAWFISPSLAIQAPEHQCGKSTVLDVVSLLVPKPRLSSSMTAAVMFRVVDQHKPTLLIDEADNLLKLDPEKLAVVNSMHRRSSAYVERCVGEGKTLAVKRFSSWAPVAFAGIGELPTTAQDRAIVVWLRRMLPEERDTIERLRLDKPAEFEVLNRKAARWGADHFDQLRAADPQVPAALGGREADKWRPLIAIADAIGPLWGEMARHAAVQLSASVTARAGQRDYNRLLQDCRRVARSTADATIEPKVLLLALLNLKDADWSTRNRGRPITPEYMAGALRHYGIRSVKGTAGARSYHWTDFADAWRRYLPPEADDDESPATSAAEDAAITASFGDIL